MKKDEKRRRIRKHLTADNRRALHSVAHFLPSETAQRLSLEVPCPVFAQDPFVAEENRRFEPHTVHVHWEPGLAEGPTSARLAVVDYDPESDTLVPPVRWDQDRFAFVRPDGEPVEMDDRPDNPWARQLNAWATVQAVLEYFEDPRILGRPVPWAFPGNRLLIVPHAGFQENAFYQRRSKALQLYYYGDPEEPHYTSLNHDILAHEAGHAILDGIRPHYLEHSSRETAAFHESMADLTALMVAFRHNHDDAHPSDAEVIDADGLAPWLSSIAEQFGQATKGRPFLRNARNDLTMKDLRPSDGHHQASQVLTGAMFDVLRYLAAQYLSPERQEERKNRATVRQALWWAADRIGRMTFQPLDLLPPVDVRFGDYARAVLANLEITDPGDPRGYREMVRRVFHERGFCPHAHDLCDARTCDLALPSPPRPKIFHDIDRLSRSPTDAYLFLHDNRDDFDIPAAQDFQVVGLYEARKYHRAVGRLPRQIVVQYLWREDVELRGPEFGPLDGSTTTLPCGGTLVFDENGNLLSCLQKPGRGSQAGEGRREQLLEHMANLAAQGRVGMADEPAVAALGVRSAPVVARTVDGTVHLETSPHLCNPYSEEGDEPWQTSF